MAPVVESFSGSHPFRPQCVINSIVAEWAQDGVDVTAQAIDRAATITVKVGEEICPRCDGPLDSANNAGSRSTRCRCVPICPRCGSDEAYQAASGRGWSQTWRWPLRKGDITRRRNKWMKYSTIVTATIAPSDGELKMLTDDGVSTLKMRPHPGGWSEFGYDDADDREEVSN